MEEDDRTFGVNYSNKGVAKLREAVTEKLKEFMGDYTDDTLVEYVIVLLKNGRRKDEAKNELDVFLGDDSLAFVSWLWDHLGSSLSLYMEQQNLHLLGEPETKSTVKQGVENELHPVEFKGRKENFDATFGHHDKKQQKGVVMDLDENEVSLPQSSNVENVRDEFHKKHGRSEPSDSRQPTSQKKRRHSEEKRPSKKEVIDSTASASRRLLQFAVRDAVAKSHPSKSTQEERSLKRLRSVISTETTDPSLEERPRRIPRTSMSAAIKAVAEAAEDVRKGRSTRSVFNRLGRDTDVSDAINHHLEEYGGVAEDISDKDFYAQSDTLRSSYNQQNSSRLPRKVTPSIHDVMRPSDSGYDGEAYDGMHLREETNEIDGFGTSGRNLAEKSQSYQYGAAAENASGRLTGAHRGSHQSPIETKASLRLGSSVDITTRNAQYPEEKERSMKERRSSTETVNGNAIPNPFPQQPQVTQTAIGLANVAPPTDDADSRTIFVSNVHFAATKDGLSRHFNKFGEVLKVIPLTDPATGLPKGSAYIEFTRTEAAELALSLDGTSFMSRILKIVKKSSAPSETASGAPRPSLFLAPKFSRAHFPRAAPSVYRGRGGVSLRPGTRSFQWKRESVPAVTSSQASISVTTPLPNRSMTYIRSEPKTNGSTDNA